MSQNSEPTRDEVLDTIEEHAAYLCNYFSANNIDIGTAIDICMAVIIIGVQSLNISEEQKKEEIDDIRELLKQNLGAVVGIPTRKQ